MNISKLIGTASLAIAIIGGSIAFTPSSVDAATCHAKIAFCEKNGSKGGKVKVPKVRCQPGRRCLR